MAGCSSSLLFALALTLSGCGSAPAGATGPAFTQGGTSTADAKRVLVVINDSSMESLEVAAYYISKRHIPRENMLRVKVTTEENIPSEAFERDLREPVKQAILGSKNPIDFVVLTKGVPIRIGNNGGNSVDGHLAAMDLSLKAIEKPEAEQVKQSINPYFNKNDSFSRKKYGFVLVTRLDGYTVSDCKRLVDNSVAAKPEKGPFLMDAAANRKGAGYADMQNSLLRAGDVLKTKGFQVEVDDTAAFQSPAYPVAGYASWGSNDSAFDLAAYKRIKFKPGALAETFVSTSGRTFKPTVGGQSLVTDLIAAGVTGIKGYVAEPYTFALAHPDILFDRYTSGFNLAESFYMASLVLKWKDIVIGDPLCRPYPTK